MYSSQFNWRTSKLNTCVAKNILGFALPSNHLVPCGYPELMNIATLAGQWASRTYPSQPPQQSVAKHATSFSSSEGLITTHKLGLTSLSLFPVNADIVWFKIICLYTQNFPIIITFTQLSVPRVHCRWSQSHTYSLIFRTQLWQKHFCVVCAPFPTVVDEILQHGNGSQESVHELRHPEGETR